jgi:hypothetical protein
MCPAVRNNGPNAPTIQSCVLAAGPEMMMMPFNCSYRNKNELEECGGGEGAWEGVRTCAMRHEPVCVFYYCRTYYKAVRVGGGGEWRTCAMRDDEPRPVWMSLPSTHLGILEGRRRT